MSRSISELLRWSPRAREPNLIVGLALLEGGVVAQSGVEDGASGSYL